MSVIILSWQSVNQGKQCWRDFHTSFFFWNRAKQSSLRIVDNTHPVTTDTHYLLWNSVCSCILKSLCCSSSLHWPHFSHLKLPTATSTNTTWALQNPWNWYSTQIISLGSFSNLIIESQLNMLTFFYTPKVIFWNGVPQKRSELFIQSQSQSQLTKC